MLTPTNGALATALLAGALLGSPGPLRAAEGNAGADAEALEKTLIAERARADQLGEQNKVLIGQVAKLREEVEALRKAITALKENFVRLQLDNDTYKKENAALAQQVEGHRLNREPAVATKVRAVEVGEQVTLVTLEAGADVRVERDCAFLVHRGGEYLGTVRVLKVEKTASVGVLIDGRKPLQVGDRAGTIRALTGGAKDKPPEPPPSAPQPAPEGEKKKPEVF